MDIIKRSALTAISLTAILLVVLGAIVNVDASYSNKGVIDHDAELIGENVVSDYLLDHRGDDIVSTRVDVANTDQIGDDVDPTCRWKVVGLKCRHGDCIAIWGWKCYYYG